MPRFTNVHGVSCSVSDVEARSLTSDWAPTFGGAAPAVESPQVESAADEELDAGAPAGNASRADWAAYAESLGIDPGDMTRDELRQAVVR